MADMAGKPPPVNGEIPLELTAAAPGYQLQFQSSRQAATTRLDYGDSTFCYGSIDSRLDSGGVKDPLENVSATMIQCDVTVSETTHASSDVTSDMDVGDDSEPCGWGPVKPSWCQVFRSPKIFLFCLCWAGAIQGMIVNGFVGVVITTIERRFDLASTESGIIASSYDVASVLCLIPVSFFGGIGRKPRWLGFGISIVGFGSFLFALPHFLTGLYNYESTREHNQCYVLGGNQHSNITEPVCQEQDRASAESGLPSYKYLFIIAQLLHGAGAAPLYTLGVTFLDENLKPKVTPVYVGVFYAMAIIGPALGYLMGGEFLKRYTDIGSVDVSRMDITPESPKWVGAWWVGFLFTATMAVIISVPLNGFPTSLPGAARLRAERVSEAYGGAEPLPTEPSFGMSLRDIFTSLKVLLTNPTFMFLSCAGASEGLLLGGFTAFAPKFIESQFSISAGLAAQLVGFAMIPAGGGGTLLGAYLIKKFDLKCAGIIKLCLITSFMSLILSLVFFIRCPNVRFAGVNTDYTMTNRTLLRSNLSAVCNNECHCMRTRYDPVCGSDGLMYFSPCFAGCKESVIHRSRKAKFNSAGVLIRQKVFFNCSCLQPSADQPSFSIEGRMVPSAALEGKCQSDCQLLAVFLPAFALVILTTFCTSMPALSATLRCVPDRQRSFALGIQWILVRCLGTIPAPIFFGAMIDGTCRLWQHTCVDRGSCLFYDNNTMGRYMLAMVVCGKGVAFLFFMLAVALYRPPPKKTQLSVMPEEAMSSNTTVQMFLKDNKVPVDSTVTVVGDADDGIQASPVAPAVATHLPAKTAMTTTSRQLNSAGLQARYQPLAQ